MKIDINKVNQIPSNVGVEFGMTVHGIVSDEIYEWVNFHGMKHSIHGIYHNFHTDKSIHDLFNEPQPLTYMDGFSPNLNKNLHIGHFSNFTLAKAFKSMGAAKMTIAILGDTLEGEVPKEVALNNYHKFCAEFGYQVDKLFMASEMTCEPNLMVDGTDQYDGTKVFDIDGKKIVGIKSSGETSYFYQDVALATKLKASTLYLTGSEQNPHFQDLKKLFPTIKHVGLGLVKSKGGKMSSSLGNVIYISDALDALLPSFGDNKLLCYNVIAGLILKSTPKSDKSIDWDQISNPMASVGLYLSYTIAKLKSAGCHLQVKELNSQDLQFKHWKSLNTLSPNVLFDGVLQLAKKISQLYISHTIKGNEANTKMFEEMGSELLSGMVKLGMFDIEKV